MLLKTVLQPKYQLEVTEQELWCLRELVGVGLDEHKQCFPNCKHTDQVLAFGRLLMDYSDGKAKAPT